MVIVDSQENKQKNVFKIEINFYPFGIVKDKDLSVDLIVLMHNSVNA